MSPFLSRRLGELLGFHSVTPDERDRIINETPNNAETLDDLPIDLRRLIDEIATRDGEG